MEEMAVYDREATLTRVSGDLTLLKEIVGLFAEEADVLLAQVKRAIQRQDPGLLEHAAHTLKGAVINFGAKPAYEAALRLEAMGEELEFAGAEEALRELEAEVARLSEGLSQFVQHETA